MDWGGGGGTGGVDRQLCKWVVEGQGEISYLSGPTQFEENKANMFLHESGKVDNMREIKVF